MNGLDFLISHNSTNNKFYGVVIGIVTNNQDPEKLGRVKVKFPNLSMDDESNWARIASPMAGKNRGLYYLPEIEDEVLVIFEQGDINFPYVLGGLWNGKDNPPVYQNNDKSDQRIIQSRSGHKIILDDTKDKENILIQDSTGKNQIMIDSKNNQITLKVDENISIESKGKITIKSSDGDLTIDCKNLSIKTQANYKLETGGDCQINASGKYDLKATSGLNVKCSAGVKINDGSLEVM